MAQQRWWEQEIPVDGTINKGELMTHNLTELIKPESYEVRLTPITRFGEGDSTVRIITYSGTSVQASCCWFFMTWETLHSGTKHTQTHTCSRKILVSLINQSVSESAGVDISEMSTKALQSKL